MTFLSVKNYNIKMITLLILLPKMLSFFMVEFVIIFVGGCYFFSVHRMLSFCICRCYHICFLRCYHFSWWSVLSFLLENVIILMLSSFTERKCHHFSSPWMLSSWNFDYGKSYGSGSIFKKQIRICPINFEKRF